MTVVLGGLRGGMGSMGQAVEESMRLLCKLVLNCGVSFLALAPDADASVMSHRYS